jgi:hypothetical protein
MKNALFCMINCLFPGGGLEKISDTGTCGGPGGGVHFYPPKTGER